MALLDRQRHVQLGMRNRIADDHISRSERSGFVECKVRINLNIQCILDS